jgi:Uma2 family endonuclease
MPTKTLLTIEQYLALPEGEKPYLEYIHGEAVPKIMGDWRHIELVTELILLFAEYRRRFGGHLGPEGRTEFTEPSGTHFLLPDMAYWARGRPFRGDRAMHPPTLAIEVRSPTDSMSNLRKKCRLMREAGTDVCWLVDPISETVEVFEGAADAVVFRGADAVSSFHLPGFTMSVEGLFAVLDNVDD